MTLRQQLFVDAYLSNGGNALAAATKAGFKDATSYSAKLLKMPEVAHAIREAVAKVMTKDEVLANLTAQARVDASEFMGPVKVTEREFDPKTGKCIKTTERMEVRVDWEKALAGGRGKLIKAVSYDKNGNPAVQFVDSQGANVTLGKYHKLWTDKTEHTGANGGAIEIKETIDINTLTPEQIRAMSPAQREEIRAMLTKDAK